MPAKLWLNAGKLLCGSGLSAVMLLLTAAVTARTLGTHNFGMLVFIQALTLVVGQIFSFNVWQAVVTFGNQALQQSDEDKLGKIVKMAFCLDLAGGVIAWLVLFAAGGMLVKMAGWPQETAAMLLIYSPAVIFSGTGATIGSLRLFRHFGILATALMTAPLFRLLGTFAAMLHGCSLYGFVIINLAATLAGQMALFGMTVSSIGRQRVSAFFSRPVRGFWQEFSQFRSFVWTTNLHSTMKMLTREADQLLTAAIIGPAGIALLKVARQFARILPIFGDPLYQTLFSELSELQAQGCRHEFSRLVHRSAFTAVLTGLAGLGFFWLFGQPVIIMAFGESFAGAWLTAMIFMLAMVAGLGGIPLQPAMLALGQPEASFRINLFATTVYLAALVPLAMKFGIEGAAGAYVLYFVIWDTLMYIRLRKEMRVND